MKVTYKNSAQSLIEMLVAVSIVVIALLGILSLVNRSLGLNRVNSDYYVATYLASEGIELTKNIFDRIFLAYQDAGRTGVSIPDLQGYFYGVHPLPSGLASSEPLKPGIYQINFNDNNSALASPVITNSDVFANCTSQITQRVLNYIFYNEAPPSCNAGNIAGTLSFLRFDTNTGFYADNLAAPESKFKRVVVIQEPGNFPSPSTPISAMRLVSSIVSWESRGGRNFVNLQDVFLPWRDPY